MFACIVFVVVTTRLTEKLQRNYRLTESLSLVLHSQHKVGVSVILPLSCAFKDYLAWNLLV